MPRVLCVDDKPEILQNIMEIISEWENSPYGEFEVIGETDFQKAIERLRNERFDFVTLDLHGSKDPDPIKDTGDQDEQEGKKVLNVLRDIRFIPVIFYTGYAEKIAMLESGVVRIVKKGENDPEKVRAAIDAIYHTGLPKLFSHIEEENRKYIWETLDKSWVDIESEGSTEDLAYLLARRLASKLNRESVKKLFKHPMGQVRPIEIYIYPPHHDEVIKTGCVVKGQDKNSHWIVATPACDFVQSKADSVLLIGATPLTDTPQYQTWFETKWAGKGDAPSKPAGSAYNKLRALLTNNAGDRYRFLPGTFFLPDIVIDFQTLRQIPAAEASELEVVCQIDSPFREELLSQLSRYYGRMGTPDIDIKELIGKWATKIPE